MTEKRYYMAYGSNLSVEQMKVRCPDAKVAGMSYLKDWRLSFKTHATIEPCKGRVVPVLVWEISEKDEQSLDLYEGFPIYYHKKDMEITMTDLDGKQPTKVTAMVYIMDERHGLRKPAQFYYDILREGYERFGFNPYILEKALHEAEGSLV